jgi:hypothetical protein
MSQWTDRVNNHPVWQPLNSLGSILDQAVGREGIDTDGVTAIERVRAILLHAQSRFGSVDPRRVELLHVLAEVEPDGGDRSKDYRHAKSHLTREFVQQKKKEFLEFNIELSAAVIRVLDVLAVHYAEEARALRVRVSSVTAARQPASTQN